MNNYLLLFVIALVVLLLICKVDLINGTEKFSLAPSIMAIAKCNKNSDGTISTIEIEKTYTKNNNIETEITKNITDSMYDNIPVYNAKFDKNNMTYIIRKDNCEIIKTLITADNVVMTEMVNKIQHNPENEFLNIFDKIKRTKIPDVKNKAKLIGKHNEFVGGVGIGENNFGVLFYGDINEKNKTLHDYPNVIIPNQSSTKGMTIPCNDWFFKGINQQGNPNDHCYFYH